MIDSGLTANKNELSPVYPRWLRPIALDVGKIQDAHTAG